MKGIENYFTQKNHYFLENYKKDNMMQPVYKTGFTQNNDPDNLTKINPVPVANKNVIGVNEDKETGEDVERESKADEEVKSVASAK